MKKSSLALMLVGALSLAMLAGCSPKESDTSSPDGSGAGSSSVMPDGSGSSSVMPDGSGSSSVMPDGSGSSSVMPDGSTPDFDPTMFKINNADFTLFAAGDSYKLSVTNTLPSDTVVYSIDKESVATIAEDGTVTAVAEGTATVTAVVTINDTEELTLTSVVRCNFKEVNPDADVDLMAFYESIAAANSISGMEQMSGELLAGTYPGLENIDLAQSAIFVSMMTMSSAEFALVEVSSSADVDAVKAIFQARIDAQVNGGAWYPAAIEIWQTNSRIVSNGNYVMMLVAENADDVVADFNELF